MNPKRGVIAVIPARGGSKRIPHKNVKEFCGKPMIAWAIEAARASELFERIIVSTDDARIAEVAAAWGAEAPFVRPPELSDDFAGTTEVIGHAANWALQQSPSLQAVCCIYATTPLLQAEDLARGLAALRSGRWCYAFSATEFGTSIYRAMRSTPEGGVEMVFPEHFTTRSQDLPATLHDAAQFYWGTPRAWIEGVRIFAPQSVPVLIPRSRVQDIDTAEDWAAAEVMFRARRMLESGLVAVPKG
jgi:pseudaminic acid cytidylyltransferase